MKAARFYQVAAAIIFLNACAHQTPEQEAALRAEAARPVECGGAEDCQVKWSRALQWVKNNSAYKFQQATDSLIATMGPLPDDPRPAYTITKILQVGGRATFDFDGGCDNIFGCVPSMLQAKASFVNYVMGPAQTGNPPQSIPGVVLGVTVAAVAPPLATTLKLGNPRGLMVAIVTPDSAAARAGIQQGDVILSVAGAPVNAPAELQSKLRSIRQGATVPVGVWREGAETTKTVQF
ncbi:MAG TPA: PDZ domain-containing protein [Alphaproteobacteria bacterium]|nr:PDZ domain-containing protein [Alphaproteobacteria bacterium]